MSGAALRTHACAKRGARSRSGVRAQQGFIFFFQPGSRSEARGQPAAPACQRPQENSPARAGTGHRAERGRMGSPRRSARVEQQGLTLGGGTSPSQGTRVAPGGYFGSWQDAESRGGGLCRGGGAQPPCGRILLRSAPRAHTRLPPRCFPRPHTTIPAVPRVGGGRPPPHTFSLSWLCPGWTNPAKTRDKIQAPRHQLPMAGGGCGGGGRGHPPGKRHGGAQPRRLLPVPSPVATGK